MRVYPPVATDNGKPIVGIVRSEVIVSRMAFDASLADRDHIAYPVANPDDPANTLIRARHDRRAAPFIPKSEWKFARVLNGAPVPDRTRVYLAGGFQPAKIYEVVYKSQNPPVAGVGTRRGARCGLAPEVRMAADALSMPAGSIQRAIAFGISQSGRFLRTYLYYGFNEDEQHRKVFDGVMAHVAGAGRGSFNLRFAQPSRDGHPFLNKFYPTDIFPFTDIAQTDPQTGEKDGLLLRVKPAFMPKIFYTNSSYEYWGRAASLIHTTIDGTNGRTARRQHAHVHVRRRPARAGCVSAAAKHRAAAEQPERLPLVDAGAARGDESLDQRRRGAAAEPLSAHRGRDAGAARPSEFPSLPGVRKPTEAHKAYRVFYGLDFASKGIISVDPPEANGSYPILVPQVDADGNELAGVKMPEVAVPLATYTGWNLFNPESGPARLLSSMQGSYIPLPGRAPIGSAASDPRPSIEERYQSREQYWRSSRRPRGSWRSRVTCSKRTSTRLSNERTLTGNLFSRTQRRQVASSQ